MKRVKGLFCRGPIPCDLIGEANRAQPKGQAGILMMALLAQEGVEGCSTFRLSAKFYKSLGIERQAKDRALKALEKVGLVEVQRKPGACPVVTLNTEEYYEKK
jgi:DNA-binding transcriptional ArsR family regulator